MIACQIHREAGRILLPINEAFGTVLLNSQARACGGVRKFFLLLVVPEALTRSKAHMVGQPRNSRDALVSFALVEVLIDAVFEVQGVTVFRVPACFGVIFSHDHYRETLRFPPLIKFLRTQPVRHAATDFIGLSWNAILAPLVPRDQCMRRIRLALCVM